MILQSRVLHHITNAIKEWTINMVLFIAFYLAYNVYCMPVYYINCKDLTLICFIRRSQLIQSLSPQLAYISCLPSLLYKDEIVLVAVRV